MNEAKIRAIRDKAKDLLLTYFSDGIDRQPADMESDLLGVFDLAGCFTADGPAWNKSVFLHAMRELVEEGKILAWEQDDGWHYRIPSPSEGF